MLKDRKLTILALVSMLFLAVALLVICLNLPNFSYPVMLSFSNYKGIDFTGSVSDVWNFLSLGGALLVINLFLAGSLFRRERFLSYLILSVGALLSFFVLLVVLTIVSLN